MTYIYSPSRHRRSGTTMQKLPRRGELTRQEQARVVLPGFPWNGQFTSREQLEEYLSGDEVTCLVCGKPYKFLAPHVKRVHALPVEEYKSRFGIPQKRGLAGASFVASKVEHGKKMAHLLTPGIEGRVKAGPMKHRPVAFVKAENAAKFRAFHGRTTYDNFDWHLETAAAVRYCRRVPPPPGAASWATFKNRRLRDTDLQARYRDARAAFVAKVEGLAGGGEQGTAKP